MPTLNERAHALANAMVADAEALGIAVSTLDCGTRIIDCGVHSPGSAKAGIKLAYICMGDAGNAELYPAVKAAWEGPGVRADGEADPISACMASQYAGWV